MKQAWPTATDIIQSSALFPFREQTPVMMRKYLDSIDGFTLPLQDGELVYFRPVSQNDRETIQKGMSALSLQSRYFRFFTPVSKLSDTQLRYFTEVDQYNHVAWIALNIDQSEDSGLGIARFIRIQEHPSIAEFAVVVIDRYQNRGLGNTLMSILYVMAKIKGIDMLRGFILPENRIMSNWLRGLGAVGEYENGICRMDLAIFNDLSKLPTTPTLKHLIDCIGKVESILSI